MTDRYFIRSRNLVVLSLAIVAAGCGAAPLPPKAPTIPFEQKMAWILQLEDQRLLRIEPPAPPPAPPAPVKGRAPRVAPAPPPPPPIDLVVLLNDTEPRIRRRAALAVGRVGLPEGVAPLVGLMADNDPEVRESAAFGLGLIGDAGAIAPLTAALADAAPLVRGRAAEAIGLIASNDTDGTTAKTAARPAADAIAKVALAYARSAPVASLQPDDEKWPAAPEAEAFKLALFALVRIGAYEPLESAVLDGGKPVSSWWPVAYALQRINDKRALQPLKELAVSPGKYSSAFAIAGLGRLRDPSSASTDRAAAGWQARTRSDRRRDQGGGTDRGGGGGGTIDEDRVRHECGCESAARERRRARASEGGRSPADRAGPDQRFVAGHAHRPRSTPPPRSTRRPSFSCSPASSPTRTGPFERRSPASSRHFRPMSRSIVCARCSTTRTSA